VWELLSEYVRTKKVLGTPHLNLPQLSGVRGNAGLG
jgi:hypothetical protein